LKCAFTPEYIKRPASREVRHATYRFA
jgi:hypothetical protein